MARTAKNQVTQHDRFCSSVSPFSGTLQEQWKNLHAREMAYCVTFFNFGSDLIATTIDRRIHMRRHRIRVAVITFAGLMLASLGAPWAFHEARSQAAPKLVFRSPQWVTVQIVTAKSRQIVPNRPGNVVGRVDYDEAATAIHATHRFPVSTSGAGQSILSVDNGLPMHIAFTGAHPAKDGSGIILTDLQFYLPINFRTEVNQSEQSLAYFPADTTVTREFHDFHRQLSIHYRGESLANTFIRMRFTDAVEPSPVIDLTELNHAPDHPDKKL